MEDILSSRYKSYHFKYIVYHILPPKIVQLCCTSYLRKYKWVKDENGNKHIKT